MRTKFTNHLATVRRRHGFTQLEVAYLLGLDARQRVSRYELEESDPNLDELFVFQAIFDVLPHELFPCRFDLAKETATERVARLIAMLDDDTRRLTAHKQQYLREALERIKRTNAL